MKRITGAHSSIVFAGVAAASLLTTKHAVAQNLPNGPYDGEYIVTFVEDKGCRYHITPKAGTMRIRNSQVDYQFSTFLSGSPAAVVGAIGSNGRL